MIIVMEMTNKTHYSFMISNNLFSIDVYHSQAKLALSLLVYYSFINLLCHFLSLVS